MVEQQKSYEHVLTYLEDALRDGKLTLGQSLPPSGSWPSSWASAAIPCGRPSACWSTWAFW